MSSNTPSPAPHKAIPPSPLLHPAAYMNLEQAEALSNLVHTMRPTWDVRGIIKTLEKLQHTADSLTLSLALLHAAQDPKNQTPGVLHYPGPHWDKARGTHTGKPKPPSPTLGTDTSAICPKHPHLHTWECKTCRRKTPKPPNFQQLVDQATQEARENHKHNTTGQPLDATTPPAAHNTGPQALGALHVASESPEDVLGAQINAQPL